MRDNPNVPLNTPGEIQEADEHEGAYFSEGHASTTAPSRRYVAQNGKPRLPTLTQSHSGSPDFVVVEAEGPTPPAKDPPRKYAQTSPDQEYFDRLPALGPSSGRTPASPGVGRKQSIMKKVKGVVGGMGR